MSSPRWRAATLVAYLLFNTTLGLRIAKTYPGDANYPTFEQWQAFNQTIGGVLLTTSLPAQACYGLTAERSQCSVASRSYGYDEPALTAYSWWADFACPAVYSPEANSTASTCNLSTSNYPSFVVRATTAQHVSDAVKFAGKHNLRLTIKNTGHDFLGRNLGYGSLSIWTHHLRGAEMTDDWKGTGQSAITIGAGMQWREVYTAAAKHKRLVVGGADNSVGVAGWIMGGGHSALSNSFGLGCDQVLEFEAVLPSGEIVVANTTSYADLFSAMRGGGGGTFAVVTKITMKTHPRVSLNAVEINMFPGSTGQTGFVKAAAYMLSQAPALTDFGISGYPILRKHSYGSYFTIPGKDWAEINNFWWPLLKKLETFGVEIYNSTIQSESNLEFFASGVSPNFATGQKSHGNAVMGSRLVGVQGLRNTTYLEEVITALFADDYIVEPFIYGGQVRRNRDLDVGVNPAWRDSVMHLSILPEAGDDATNKSAVEMVYGEMQKKHIPLVDKLSVDSGAYLNEASYAEPEWKKVFWGSSYAKLLAVKNKYDPTNLLWCFPCVGADVFQLGNDNRLYSKGSVMTELN